MKTKSILASIIAFAAISASATAVTEKSNVTDHVGTSTGVVICEKGDRPTEIKYLHHLTPAALKVIHAAGEQGCFERLGESADEGYSRAGVVLTVHDNSMSTYDVSVNGKPMGQAIRAQNMPGTDGVVITATGQRVKK